MRNGMRSELPVGHQELTYEEWAQAYLRSVKWEVVAGGIQATVDVAALFPAIDAFGKYQAKPEDLAKSKAAAQAMEERKLPIDQGIHAADIAEQFSQGTLGGN